MNTYIVLTILVPRLGETLKNYNKFHKEKVNFVCLGSKKLETAEPYLDFSVLAFDVDVYNNVHLWRIVENYVIKYRGILDKEYIDIPEFIADNCNTRLMSALYRSTPLNNSFYAIYMDIKKFYNNMPNDIREKIENHFPLRSELGRNFMKEFTNLFASPFVKKNKRINTHNSNTLVKRNKTVSAGVALKKAIALYNTVMSHTILTNPVNEPIAVLDENDYRRIAEYMGYEHNNVTWKVI